MARASAAQFPPRLILIPALALIQGEPWLCDVECRCCTARRVRVTERYEEGAAFLTMNCPGGLSSGNADAAEDLAQSPLTPKRTENAPEESVLVAEDCTPTSAEGCSQKPIRMTVGLRCRHKPLAPPHLQLNFTPPPPTAIFRLRRTELVVKELGEFILVAMYLPQKPKVPPMRSASSHCPRARTLQKEARDQLARAKRSNMGPPPPTLPSFARFSAGPFARSALLVECTPPGVE
ncbi:hypothetical protein C8R47DRAFT_1072161 [Mycena vitilis]|nr:hypothetical protein C8R47DRAFT_1072161 [Mycena vitilis]